MAFSDYIAKHEAKKRAALNRYPVAPTLFFMNAYRDKRDGTTSFSDQERSTEQPHGLNTIADVEADLFNWAMINEFHPNEYVATLSNDGIDHTPALRKRDAEIRAAIHRASAHDAVLSDYGDLGEFMSAWGPEGDGADRKSDYEEHNTHYVGAAL